MFFRISIIYYSKKCSKSFILKVDNLQLIANQYNDIFTNYLNRVHNGPVRNLILHDTFIKDVSNMNI